MDEAVDVAAKSTDEWWYYLKSVNQLNSEVCNLDPRYWEWLENKIAEKFKKYVDIYNLAVKAEEASRCPDCESTCSEWAHSAEGDKALEQLFSEVLKKD